MATLGASAAPAPASASASTTWAGWTSPGPAPRVFRTAAFAARGGTVATIGMGDGGVLRLRVVSDRGTVTGGLPTASVFGADPLVERQTAGLDLALPTPGRLLMSRDESPVAGSCSVLRSDDLGVRWTTGLLRGCSGGLMGLQALDAEHVFVAGRGALWTSGDGGSSWGTAIAQDPAASGFLALSPTTVLRLVTTGGGSAPSAVQRSVDGGRTWSPVALPPVPSTPDGPAPGGGAWTELTPPVLRSDGAVLVGARGAVLISVDGGRTFRSLPLPAVQGPSSASPTPRATAVLCDPAAHCAVRADTAPIGVSQSGAFGVLLDGDRIGGRVPAPPSPGSAPAPGVIVGTTPSEPPLASDYIRTAGDADVRSTDGGRSYRILDDGILQVGNVGGHGLIAVRVNGVLHVSMDHGRSFRAFSDLADRETRDLAIVRRLVRSRTGLLALTHDGHVRRRARGRWADVADVRRVRPRDLDATGGVVLVAGRRGILRIADGHVRAARGGVLSRGPLFTISARGRTAVAIAARGVVRSADGGAHWSAVRGPDLSAVQVITPRLVLGVTGNGMWRSTDGGRVFRRIGAVPPVGQPDDEENDGDLGPADLSRYADLSFADARHGVVSTEDEVAITDDGGRTLVPTAVPPNVVPAFAVPDGRGGVVAQDTSTGTLFRASAATLRGRPPVLDVRRVGAPGRSRASGRSVVVQTVAGHLRGAPSGASVEVLVRTPGLRGLRRVATIQTNVDGTFRASVPLARRPSEVTAWFAGVVLPRRTVPSASSAAVGVRALRAGEPGRRSDP